jgi:hypothetical protein
MLYGLNFIFAGILRKLRLKYFIFSLLAVAAVGMWGCAKKDSGLVFGPYTLQNIFNSMAVTPTRVTLNASAGGTFYGASGARYSFPSFSLERDSVQITGNVDVSVAEYLKVSDMIFSSVLPYSNGSPLVTAGAYYINITQNGQTVILARPAKYQVYLPVASAMSLAGLSLYFGRPDDTIASNSVNWQPITDTAHGWVTAGTDTVVITSDSIHFNAASRNLLSPAYQSFALKVTAPITTFSDTLVAYAVFDSLNSVWQMSASHDHTITETMVPNSPVHFVVFTVINGDFYAGITAATPVSGNTYTVNLTKTSPVALRQKIDGLP